VTFLTSRLNRLRDLAARATPAAMLVRLALGLCGVAAVVSALPLRLLTDPRFVLFSLVVGLLPVLWPRTMIVSVVMFAVVVAFAFFGVGASIGHVVLVAGLLYLVHTGAALTAVLPYDTVVAPLVLAGWLVRALGVIAATGVVAVMLSLLTSRLDVGTGTLIAGIAGVVLMCAVVYLLSRVARGRNTPS
jgi:hypothetical protein